MQACRAKPARQHRTLKALHAPMSAARNGPAYCQPRSSLALPETLGARHRGRLRRLLRFSRGVCRTTQASACSLLLPTTCKSGAAASPAQESAASQSFTKVSGTASPGHLMQKVQQGLHLQAHLVRQTGTVLLSLKAGCTACLRAADAQTYLFSLNTLGAHQYGSWQAPRPLRQPPPPAPPWPPSQQ